MTKAQQRDHLLQELESNFKELPLAEKPEDMVMGFGNVDSEVMFIGEAPGRNEAEQRRPFVGRAGQLFNQTLAEHGMKREDFYVSNIVKVRPPNNRDPLPAEINAFVPYLYKEIEIIEPLLFVSLGRFSMNFFLPDAKISAIHGVLQRFMWEGKITYLLPVYHPAAALRNGNMKASFSQDLAKIPKALEYIKKQKKQDEHVSNVHETLL